MSDHAGLQGQSPVASTSAISPLDDRPRVSANSFRALTDRLKRSVLAEKVETPSQHIPDFKPQPEATVEISVVAPVVQPAIIAEPIIVVEEPVVVQPVTVVPEPVVVVANQTVQAIPTQVSAFDISAVLPPAVVPPETDITDISEIAVPSESAVSIEPIVTAVTIVAPVIESAPLVEAIPEVDLAALRKREATVAEFELLLRMIYAVPSHEDRAEYLKEAAVEHAALARIEAERSVEFVQPVAEDVDAFLSDDLASHFAPAEQNIALVPGKTTVAATPLNDFSDLFALAESNVPSIEETVVVSSVVAELPRADEIRLELQEEATAIAAHVVPAVPTEIFQNTADSPIAINTSGSIESAEAGELARSLLDMMAATSSTGLPQERALAADTLLRLLPKLPIKALIMLSERLAIMDAPPHLLVSKIIADPRIEVAGPLLENGLSIPDQDLVAVIAEEDPKKLRLIGRRRKLSRHISASLVACKDPSTHLTLVRNAAAEISHETFLILTNTARHEPELLAPLATRKDLPAPLAFELFWYAPAQLRRYILSRFLTDSETLTKILKITLATQGLDESHEASSVSTEVVQNALQLAIAGKLTEAAEVLAPLSRLNGATIERILADSDGEPLSVLLKAIGYPRGEVKALLQVLQLAETGLLDQQREVDELVSIYETLSYNKARILLTYWDWATQRSGPYALMH